MSLLDAQSDLLLDIVTYKDQGWTKIETLFYLHKKDSQPSGVAVTEAPKVPSAPKDPGLNPGKGMDVKLSVLGLTRG